MTQKKVYESTRRAQKKWKVENRTQFYIRVKKGERDKIKTFAESKGLSVGAFIRKAIYEAMGENPDDMNDITS